MADYQGVADDQLLELLYTEEDRLPRAVVAECVRRGDRLVGLFADILSDRDEWRDEDFDHWAPVHATYILGAIGTEDVIVPLLKALRLASAYDNDWVSGDLPAIFGRIGRPAMEGLRGIAVDKTNDWETRSTAISGLEAIAVNHPETEEEAVAVIGSIFKDWTDEADVREMAALSLLDMLRTDYKDDLLAYARKEPDLFPEGTETFVDFSEEEIESAFAKRHRLTAPLTHDWLNFYNDEEIEGRQARWAEELESDNVDVDEDGIPVQEPFMLNRARVGRNDPCPCGSGRKFKKCCLGKEPDDGDILF